MEENKTTKSTKIQDARRRFFSSLGTESPAISDNSAHVEKLSEGLEELSLNKSSTDTFSRSEYAHWKTRKESRASGRSLVDNCAPNSIEAAANSIEAVANSIETAPNGKEAAANSIEALANSIETAPNCKEADANSIETAPNSKEAAANSIETAPNSIEAVANSIEAVAESEEVIYPSSSRTNVEQCIGGTSLEQDVRKQVFDQPNTSCERVEKGGRKDSYDDVFLKEGADTTADNTDVQTVRKEGSHENDCRKTSNPRETSRGAVRNQRLEPNTRKEFRERPASSSAAPRKLGSVRPQPRRDSVHVHTKDSLCHGAGGCCYGRRSSLGDWRTVRSVQPDTNLGVGGEMGEHTTTNTQQSNRKMRPAKNSAVMSAEETMKRLNSWKKMSHLRRMSER